MEWQNFVDWLTGVTKNPAFIAIVSIACMGAVALIVLSKTSLGRKTIEKITDLCNSNSRKVDEYWKNTESIYKSIEDEKIKIANLKSECESKVKIYLSELTFFKDSVCEMIEMIPNAKVQEKLAAFKTKWELKKVEIEKAMGVTYTEIENKIIDAELIQVKQKEEIAILRGEIDELKQLLVNSEKTKETADYGEGNEGINNKTEEE